MVNEKEESPRCYQCDEVWHHECIGFVYCHYLRHEVWGMSLMCQHGLDLRECF